MNDTRTESFLEKAREIIRTLPDGSEKDFVFETEQFLGKLSLLALKANPEAFARLIDRQRIRQNLYEFLKDDLVYFLQKLLSGRQSFLARAGDLIPAHKSIIPVLREFGVTVYYPAGKDFSRLSILERWYMEIAKKAPLTRAKVLNYFDVYRNRLYSLTDEAPFEFSDVSRLVRKMLTSGEYEITFEEIYNSENVLRQEILFSLLKNIAADKRLDYLISKEIISDLSDRFIHVLHNSMQNSLKEDLERQKEINLGLEREKTAIESEIQSARRAQTRNIQRELPETDSRLSFALFYEPIMDLGGDFYFIKKLNDHEYSIFLADISGHGIGAAMYMNTLRMVYDRSQEYLHHPGKLFRKMNETLYGKLGDNFITGICIHLHLKKKQLKYSSAGHPDCFLIQDVDGRRKTRMLRPNGRVLGIFEKSEFPESTIPLTSRNRLLVYTDGASEASSEDDSFLTERGLLKLFRNLLPSQTKEALQEVQRRLANFRGRKRAEDDTTMILADIFPD